MSLGYLDRLVANISAATSDVLRERLSHAAGAERDLILEMEGELKRGILHEIKEKFSWSTELPYGLVSALGYKYGCYTIEDTRLTTTKTMGRRGEARGDSGMDDEGDDRGRWRRRR
eukprot:2475934-Pyramimonas_sp.AAC.1